MFKKRLFILGFVLIIILFVGCEADPPEEPAEKPVDEPEYGMGYVDDPLKVDGSSDGYPLDPLEEAGAVIHLAHDDQYIYVHLEAEVEGWVSTGFNESGVGMDGANMVIGYLSGEEMPAFRDDVGSGRTHSEAGVTEVEAFHLARSDGVTVMEFSYPLNFSAEVDYNVEEIRPGEIYSLIIAMHDSSDDIDTKHSVRGMTDFQVQP